MDTLKIGMPATLSGKYATQGIESFKGITLWIKSVVQKKGIRLKSKILIPELIYYDNKSNTAKTGEITKKLIEKDEVDILLGPYSSSLTLESLIVSEKYERVLWNYGGSSDDIHNYGYDKVISTITEASNYFKEIINLINSIENESKEIALLKVKSSNFSSNVAQGSVIFSKEKGINLDVFDFNSGEKNFSEILNEINQNNIKYILCVGSAQDDINFCNYLIKNNNKFKIVATLAAAINEFKNELRNECENFISTSQWEPELNISINTGPDLNKFIREFKNEYGYLPDYPSAQAYNMGIVIEYLISECDDTNENVLLKKAKSSSFSTFYGKFKLDKSGKQIGHEMLVIQWQNGRKKIIFPKKYANSKLIIKK
ncbi:MAG: ABC transporter substrate-binding protein [Candidatus Dadabacteria bacterium]|nr:ABC transporter substrate-binding protein [Candidatus Dadabacteria bacterium]NIQ13358.1 ABC transporter substrate-binding protein [Candidatus Dadabacteria bacterium]